jgi:class 3 adenylate cyclase
MKLPSKGVLRIHILELCYSIVLLAWFFIPLADSRSGVLVPPLLPLALLPSVSDSVALFWLLSVMVWSIPLLATWKIAAILLSGRIPSIAEAGRVVPDALNVLSSSLVLVCFALHALAFASNALYFVDLPFYTWIMVVASLAYNAYFILSLIDASSAREESSIEYREFKADLLRERKSPLGGIRRGSIQRRLVLLFVSIIFLVIVILCGVLLRDFGNTMLNAVIANGETLAERTANVVKSSIGDTIALDDYFRFEFNNNALTAFPFVDISYYSATKGKTLVAVASTERSKVGLEGRLPEVKVDKTTMRKDRGSNRIEFLSPVDLGGRLIGYAMVSYDMSIIYEPYFRTQVKVSIIAMAFIYLTTFITYMFSHTIVLPILFLRMSTTKIARVLESMMKGLRKISAAELSYRDRVRTNDEIKDLSRDFEKLATAIAGVVPYISISTLRHAESAKPSSENIDQAFLFTDIRGFTSISEGKPPGEIVDLLNYFLELQASVILANGGDIDKFVGDEIMAVFEDPDKELKACRASVGIKLSIAKEKELALAAGEKEVSIGIGIHSGPVTRGSVGARIINRMDFTSIGDTVNLAARLEGANKEYGTKALISEAVYGKVKSDFLCREIDLLTVKGKKESIRIYEVLQERGAANPRIEELIRRFEEGLSFYRKRDWPSAALAFQGLVDDLDDAPSRVFLKRVAYFRDMPPPAEWDGLFALEVK